MGVSRAALWFRGWVSREPSPEYSAGELLVPGLFHMRFIGLIRDESAVVSHDWSALGGERKRAECGKTAERFPIPVPRDCEGGNRELGIDADSGGEVVGGVVTADAALRGKVV
jgi:hypothetical protein